MIELPSWYSSLATDDQLSSLYIHFFDEQTIIENNPNPEASILIGENKDMGNYQKIEFWFQPDSPAHIHVVIGGELDFMRLKLSPSMEALERFANTYILPGEKIPRLPIGAGILANVNRIREAQPVALASEEKKQIRFFIGLGDWDTMEGLENGLVTNPYIANYTICQATASGENDELTQHYTNFSASLYSIMRVSAYGGVFFYCFIEYIPHAYIEAVQEIKRQNENDYPFLNSIPDDIPLDVIGALASANYQQMFDREALLQNIEEGNIDSLLVLSLMVYPAEFEEVFLPLANHQEQKFRDFVAAEAAYRNVESILELALKNGISEKIQEHIQEILAGD